MTALGDALAALTQWQVPAGYSGQRADAFENECAVPMVRVDDLLAALKPWLNPDPPPPYSQPEDFRPWSITMMVDALAFVQPWMLSPGKRVKVMGLGSDGSGEKLGTVREDCSILWDEE